MFYAVSVAQSTPKSYGNSSLDDLMFVDACVLLKGQEEGGGKGPYSVDDLEPKPWVNFGLPCRALRLERGPPFVRKQFRSANNGVLFNFTRRRSRWQHI